MRKLAMLFVALAFFAAEAAWSATTVIVVRHAEKVVAEGNDDPALSESGRRRAAALAHALADVPIDAVFVTQYRRTLETARPAASSRGIEPTVRDAREVRATAAEALRTQADRTTLICAHSNTVPDTLRALGVETDISLTEEDYDDLFIVTIDDAGNATMLHLHYGEPSA